jgi:hypothetical protein
MSLQNMECTHKQQGKKCPYDERDVVEDAQYKELCEKANIEYNPDWWNKWGTDPGCTECWYIKNGHSCPWKTVDSPYKQDMVARDCINDKFRPPKIQNNILDTYRAFGYL